MRKDRKSAYEHWIVGPVTATANQSVSLGGVELEKLRQLEAMKWVFEDILDELREIRRRHSPRA